MEFVEALKRFWMSLIERDRSAFRLAIMRIEAGREDIVKDLAGTMPLIVRDFDDKQIADLLKVAKCVVEYCEHRQAGK